MKQREQWGTRTGFVLAAIGSAIGLGNIWRFPYVAYENGGGAFFIPYLFAMLTAGIPFLILEFGTGRQHRSSAPRLFAKISKNWEWLGWWQILVSFVISLYYVAIVGWTILYCFLAFNQGWGVETGEYFYKSFLQLSNSPLEMNGIRWPIFAAIAATWGICWFVLFNGVKKGIETASKIFMPLLFVIVLIITAKAVTLPGSMEGLNWLFQPDFSALLNIKVWVAAYGQLFYSLSIGFAIMLTYSSYLPKESDIANNACITAFVNCGFSIVAGILVFSVLGNMALQQGVGIDKVVSQSVGLAFITFPKAINSLPWPVFFGVLFFTALLFAGLSSHISICETVISAIMEKFSLSRKKAVSIYCVVGLLAGSVFATNSGLFILDIVDHFINNFGILATGLVEIILLSWLCKLDIVRKNINATSDFSVGGFWVFCLKIITPSIIAYLFINNFVQDIQTGYGDYTINVLFYFGWFPVITIAVIAFILQIQGSMEEKLNNKTKKKSQQKGK